jgi:hypothetical protein
LQGLRLEANKGNWEPTAWRDLLWAADNNGERVFQFELADLLLRMPDALLSELLPYATSWIWQRREILLAADCPGGPHFLRLWDRLALLTYREENPEDVGSISGDILMESLNSPGGILAWSLLETLIATKPEAEYGLGPELSQGSIKLWLQKDALVFSGVCISVAISPMSIASIPPGRSRT